MSRSLLLVTTTYEPVVGGSEVEALRICSGLRERGWSVEVLCQASAGMPDSDSWLDSRGTPVRQFGRGWAERWRNYAHAAGVAWHLWRRRGEYDAVYFLMTGLQLATGLPAARLAGKPILMKFSGSNTIRPLSASRLGRWELEMLARWARVIMVLNPAMEEEAREAGLPGGRLEWMPNPVDTRRFSPAGAEERQDLRKALGLRPEEECVLFVGRLAPEKELPVLVNAFAQVAGRRPLARLVLVGDGPERPALEKQIAGLGLQDRVRLTGFAGEDRVLDWLRAADVFALLSSLEGFPVSLVEAMAAGLPVVVSDIPANRQLIDGEAGGTVVPLGDARAAAAALEIYLADGERARRTGAQGRAIVEASYTSRQVLDRYERLLADGTPGQISDRCGA